MARNQQEFETIVKLNAQQAQDELKLMEDKLTKLKKDKADLLNSKNYNPSDLRDLNKEIRKTQAGINAYRSSVLDTINTLKDLDHASLGEIEKAVRSLKKHMKGVTDEDEYRQLDELVQKGSKRILELKSTVGEAASETQRLSEAGQNVSNVLSNINDASLKDLKAAAAALNEEMSKLKPDSSAYAKQAASLKQVNDRIKEVNDRQKESNLTLDKYNREIQETTKSQQQIARENKVIDKTLSNLSGSTLRDLEYSLQMVKEQIRQVGKGSDEFKDLTEKARKLDAEIKKIKKDMEEQPKSKSFFSKGMKLLNDNWGAMTQIWGAITGLSDTVRQCTKAFADMDQEMVNVQKYTGQTKEQVVEMNEDFKKMNTRTSREQLNQLAGAAGRLGKTSKKDIEDFVDAADKISVALGDDLGDKAVDQVGKLAMMFGEDKKKGLKGAMLSTGSAVNELAQSSSASAGYLVDFTARLSGVAKQAGLTQQQIMGFASVLDQNMQQDETAATAMQNLITKIFQEPAKFAALAGMKVKEFTNLLKTDANSALLQFFGAMKKNGGFAQLAPMFDEMQMDGSRAVGVLSVMADKLADVKTAQDIANKAYDDGKSVITEFNTQMESEQAKLDMAKKNFKELAIQLGEQLLPVAKYTISTGALLIKSLSVIINYTKNHIGLLAKLAAAITLVTVVYNAAAVKAKLFAAWEAILNGYHKAGIIITRTYTAVTKTLQVVYFVLTGQIKKAKAAMDAMRAASISNPYAALTTVLLVLGAAIYKLISSIREHNKALHDNLVSVRSARAAAQDMSDATKEVNKNTAEEKTRIERLTNIINSNVYSYNEKKNAMIALEKIVPGYHRNLRNEASLTRSNNQALKEYVDRLNDAAMAQALYNRMVELQGKQFDLETEIKNHNRSAKAVQAEINRHPDYYNATETHWIGGGVAGGYTSWEAPTEANTLKHKELQQWVDLSKKAGDNLQVVKNRIKNINDYMDEHKGVRQAYDRLVEKGNAATETPPDWNPNKNKPGTYVDPKKAAQQQKSAEAAAKKKEREMKAAEKARYNEEIKTAKGATDKEQAQNILAYSQGKKTYTQYLDDQHDIAIRGYKALETIYKKYGTDYGQWQDQIAEEEKRKTEDHGKALLSDIELNKEKEEMAAKKDYEDPNSDIFHNEQALNERLFEIDMSAMADRVAALQEGTQEWIDAKAEMTQKEEEHELSLRQNYSQLLGEYREQWGQKDVKEQERIALQGLDDLHSKGLVKEKEYQEMLKNIKLHYELEQSQQNLQNSSGEQFKRNADTAYQTAKNNANADFQNDHPTGTGVMDYVASDVTIFSSTIDNIKQMEKDAVISHEEAMAAMGQATADMCAGIASKMQAAYDAVSPIMDAMSSYYSAQCDLEVTQTEKKYEKLIDRAGNNQAKQKKLQEKQEKEIAKIKTKYNKKQVKMQIAQAIAQSAMSAISAYASVMAGAPWPANQILAPIAAGLALAAGAIQIATIKKQAQAQEAGYYEGGFTGGSSYRREAGVVHEGEFVANHHAVNNPQLLPAFRLLDQAQRNNTVGSLSATDVSRSMGVGGATVVSAPQINVTNDNSDIAGTLQQARDTIDSLGELLASGQIIVKMPDWDDFDRSRDHWEKIKGNK